MRALTVTDSEEMILVLQDEIRRSDQSRYDHRLHGVLLVAQGMSANQAAGYLGDSPRSVQYWVKRLNEEGLSGLTESPGRGRPGRLSENQLRELGSVLRESPRSAGIAVNLWDGKTLRHWLKEHWQVQLSVLRRERAKGVRPADRRNRRRKDAGLAIDAQALRHEHRLRQHQPRRARY